MTGAYGDIICAPASGRGGAVAIVRISGGGCLSVVDSVVRFKNGSASESPGFRVKFGVVPELDEVLVCIFRAPHSYTGEDMAEISCHASPYIVSSILGKLCAAGCRLAAPGEFTQRAFTAGKMDLSQAEAVADLISADSIASHKLAYSQLRGKYSEKLRLLRAQIVKISALLELELDFSEEDVEFADRARLQSLVQDALGEVHRLSDSFKLGNAFKKGIPVVLAGAVNSGKSTLLNALLGEERAIVSDIPGTTRDTIEEVISLEGINYRLIDTAGLRDSSDTVERMGIERSVSQMRQALITVAVLDSTAPEDVQAEVVRDIRANLPKDSRLIIVRNKVDKQAGSRKTDGIIDISAKTGLGLDQLRAAIASDNAKRLDYSDAVLVTNQRHYEALRKAGSELENVLNGILTASPTDLVAEDLRAALNFLGEIFGEVTPDDVLGKVFSSFCIGK
ncbi:MAG: tRNA uridine-5-carboxymethylaminomethyl(34) synthesis GTPase MnmE [Bacteroidales bacterium]|nr:tRNA uridine-5-carboxymethylaminomethyl(34) synthesis GTPase MnmE [Bacteroidales bacterium]